MGRMSYEEFCKYVITNTINGPYIIATSPIETIQKIISIIGRDEIITPSYWDAVKIIELFFMHVYKKAEEYKIWSNELNKTYPLVCPETGEFYAYKKILSKVLSKVNDTVYSCKTMECIVTLLIPVNAKRSSAFGKKCRCSNAVVKSIEIIKTGESIDKGYSYRDANFKYKVGEMVSVDNFDGNRWNECSTGIHFFMNKEDAINFYM